jgi:hypothetical protein
MAISQESITKLKTDYEAKIAKLPKAAQTAAKSVWNKVIEAALVTLTAQLVSVKSIKILDKVSLGVALGAVSKLTTKATAYKDKVQVPMKKVLAGSNSSETQELNKTLDSVNTSNNDDKNVSTNNAARQATSVAKVEKDVKDLELNIASLNKLKF